MDDAETEFGLGMAALGSKRIPPPRLGEIDVNADAARIQEPELRLGVDKAPFGGGAAPTEGVGRLLLHREPIREDQTAIALGDILVDSRRGLIPTRDAAIGAAVQIGKAKLVLCLLMSLLGRMKQPNGTVAEAGDDRLTAQVAEAEPISPLRVTGSGRPPEEPESLREIASGARGQSAAYGPAEPAATVVPDVRAHASPH